MNGPVIISRLIWGATLVAYLSLGLESENGILPMKSIVLGTMALPVWAIHTIFIELYAGGRFLKIYSFFMGILIVCALWECGFCGYFIATLLWDEGIWGWLPCHAGNVALSVYLAVSMRKSMRRAHCYKEMQTQWGRLVQELQKRTEKKLAAWEDEPDYKPELLRKIAAMMHLPSPHILPQDKAALVFYNPRFNMSDVEAMLHIKNAYGADVLSWSADKKQWQKMDMRDLMRRIAQKTERTLETDSSKSGAASK